MAPFYVGVVGVGDSFPFTGQTLYLNVVAYYKGDIKAVCINDHFIVV